MDGRWVFVEHFDKLAPQLGKRADALMGLMPNLRDPRDGARRTYTYAVMAGALYGALVWFRESLASRRIRANLRAIQVRLAWRVVRAFHTASGEATLVLAGLPPAELTADAQAWCYARSRAVRLQEGVVIPRVASLLRVRVCRRAINAWQENLANDPPAFDTPILEAILPHLDE